LTKSILPILTGLFARKGEKAGHSSVSHLLHFATATIKHELSAMILKISLALVATGVLIFSLIMIGRHINDAFQVYDNGPLLAGIFFGVVSAACFATLFLLFRDKSNLPEVSETASAGSGQIHEMAEKALHSFLAGLNSGLSAPSKTEKIEIIEDGESELRDTHIEDYSYSEIVH